MPTGRMTLEQLVAALDLDAVPSDHSLDSTLKPTLAPRYRRDNPPSTPAPARSLPPPPKGERSSREIRIRGPLAEGGMGTIMLGEQPALRRNVALKTLRSEFMEPEFAQRLRREARILALVEHPNVVPVHALETDERNAPVVVMKRIEGTPWRALVRDRDHPALPADVSDKLAWHLRVLIRVCEAVHYAHSRGVLHLDLKPDNVMIGAFDEVYLVDWGVAVAIEPTQRGWLPMADEVAEILGTPAYLAPEMVDLDRAPLGPATDVFLLGATLYEILLGHPPHQGETLHELLHAAYAAEVPTLPPTVPEELARITRRAMDPDPTQRFENVSSLRRALSDFLEHRAAASVASNARDALEELIAVVAQDPASGREPTDPRLRVPERQDQRNAEVQRIFGRSRFGFAEALRLHPKSDEAREGLTSALMTMAEYHLHRGEAASAEGLLEELQDEPRAQSLRADAARQRAQAARLERLEREEIRDEGSVLRGRLLFTAALVVTIPGLLGYVGSLLGIYRYAWWHTLAFAVALSALLAGGSFWFREKLMATRRGRRIMWTIILMALMSIALRTISFSLGVRGHDSLALELFFFGSGSVVTGVLIDPRFHLAAIGFYVGVVLVLLAPAHMMLWVALSSLFGPGLLGWAWMRADLSREKAEQNSPTGATSSSDAQQQSRKSPSP